MKTSKLNPKYHGLVGGIIGHLRFEKYFPDILDRLKQHQDNQQQNVVLWDGICEEWLSNLLSKSDKEYLESSIRKVAISTTIEQNEDGPSFILYVEPAHPLYSVSHYEITLTGNPIHIDSVFINYDNKVKGDNLTQLLSWCE